jgi:hypothetical protein
MPKIESETIISIAPRSEEEKLRIRDFLRAIVLVPLTTSRGSKLRSSEWTYLLAETDFNFDMSQEMKG